MLSTPLTRVRAALLGAGALLGVGLQLAAPAAGAQTSATGQESPADALARNLRSLAQNPKSVSALMGAGMAALQVGDPQASLSFFARAEDQLPRDGRIKMWMGSALVQLQQPQAAMKFFNEASELGVAENDIARDRGLAWDIMGDQRRAQRDYQLALRRGADPELTRRLALSLGISGDRERALQLLEEQLLVQDRAALRTRALVLALTGDAAGAARAVEQSLPPGQAAVMAPFLVRLPGLSPSDRALAVHLGHFPTPGRPATPPQSYAANPYAARPAPPPSQYASVDAATRAGTPDRNQGALGSRTSPPPAPPPVVTNAPRRRPGADNSMSSGRALAGFSIASPGQQPPAPVQAQPLPPAQQRPVQLAENRAVPSVPAPRPPEPGFSSAVQNSAPAGSIVEAVPPPSSAPAQPVPQIAAPAVQSRPVPPAIAQPLRQQPVSSAQTSPPPARRAESRARGRIADLASVLEDLDEPAARPARAAGARETARGTQLAARDAGRAGKATADRETGRDAKGKAAGERSRKGRTGAEEADPPAKGKKAAAPAREPSRVWVQVAGGANKSALPRAYAQVKGKAPKLLGSRSAWTVPNRATNRVLVGPFPNAGEAQEFVNKLAGADVSAFTFTSESGQKVEKLPPK